MDRPREELDKEFFEELYESARAARHFAIRNYFFAYFVSGIIVISSIAAGISVGAKPADIPDWWKSALASLPAVMLTASTVFRFEQKSAWFWKKTKALDSLVRQVKYEGLSSIEASKKLSEIEENMERSWVSFGIVGKSGEEKT
jgi:hypothetical protein